MTLPDQEFGVEANTTDEQRKDIANVMKNLFSFKKAVTYRRLNNKMLMGQLISCRV